MSWIKEAKGTGGVVLWDPANMIQPMSGRTSLPVWVVTKPSYKEEVDSIPSLPLTTTIPFVSSGWLVPPLHLLPFRFTILYDTLPLLTRVSHSSLSLLISGEGVAVSWGMGLPLVKGVHSGDTCAHLSRRPGGASPWAPSVMGLPLVKGVCSGDTCALGPFRTLVL
jgi:hypothetical protein